MRITIDKNQSLGKANPMIYGHFLEHFTDRFTEEYMTRRLNLLTKTDFALM